MCATRATASRSTISGSRSAGDRGGDLVETVVLDRESLAGLPSELPRAPRRGRVRAHDVKKRTRVTHRRPSSCRPTTGRWSRRSTSPSSSRSTTSARRAGTGRRERDGFYYSRVSNPTLRQLELALAELQGTRRLPADRVRCCRHRDAAARAAAGRRPRRVFRRDRTSRPGRSSAACWRRYGVASTMLSIDDLAALERVLAARRRA